jgi:hypothetical protein
MEEKKFDALAHARGFVGIIVGGAAGFFLFQWLVDQGFYGLAIPGAVMGLACGFASRIHSPILAATCGICATLLLPYAEWKVLPFAADDSLGYFLTHLNQLRPLTWIMFALGIVFAAWFGLGRPQSRR